MQRAHAAAGFTRDTLLAGFPRLLTLLEGLHDRLARGALEKTLSTAVESTNTKSVRLYESHAPISVRTKVALLYPSHALISV